MSLLAKPLNDPDVTTLFDDINIEIDTLRSSANLKQFLHEVALQMHKNKMIPSFGMHAVHVRLNAINFLLVQELCTPRLYDLFGRPDVHLATTIFVHSFTLFRKVELIVHQADAIPIAINSHRCHLFALLMRYKQSSLVPFAVTLREHGPAALQALTAHLLTVTTVGEELRQSIEGVIQQLIALTAGQGLTQDHLLLLLDFFNWASRHTLVLQADCRKEELVSAVDSRVRALLRSEQYDSPQHLIDSYDRHYKQHLTQIAVPLQPYSVADLEQARKDLLREELCVNKQRYLCGTEGWIACRQELRKVLTFVFGLVNEEMLEQTVPITSGRDVMESRTHSSSNTFSWQLVSLGMEQKPNNSSTTEDDFDSSFKRSLSNTSFASAVTTSAATTLSSQQHHNYSQKETTTESEIMPMTQRSSYLPSHIQLRQPSLVYHDLLCLLHAAILISASRTFAGGDAFILLHELYGGEGLMFSALPFLPSSRSGDGDHGNGDKKEEAAAKIAITTNGLKVTLRVRYLLQSTEAVSSCSDCQELHPLMGFDCCTTTLLLLSAESLQQLEREEEDMEETEGEGFSSGPHGQGIRLFRAMVLQPQRILHRAVSIQPFLPSKSMVSS